MSMPLNRILHLFRSGLPLVLLVCCAVLACWFGLQANPLPVAQQPFLHEALKNTPLDGQSEIAQPKQSGADDFAGNDPFFRQPQPVEPSRASEQELLEEVRLTMVARGAQGRFCRTNGQLMREGETGTGFTVKKVESHGVLYQTDLEKFFLIPGQKATLRAGRIVSLEKMKIPSRDQKKDAGLEPAPLESME